MPPKEIDDMKSFAFLFAVSFTLVLLINIGTRLLNMHKLSYLCSNRIIRFHGVDQEGNRKDISILKKN